LLRELGNMMKSYIRNSDTAFRYGGEEFAIILPHTDQHSAMILSERLREAVSSKSFLVREKLQIGHITISIGVSSYPEDAVEVDSLINYADMALYQAKKTKNCVCSHQSVGDLVFFHALKPKRSDQSQSPLFAFLGEAN
jgi:diguanylate cyclase (GGDEF)-like protein